MKNQRKYRDIALERVRDRLGRAKATKAAREVLPALRERVAADKARLEKAYAEYVAACETPYWRVDKEKVVMNEGAIPDNLAPTFRSLSDVLAVQEAAPEEAEVLAELECVEECLIAGIGVSSKSKRLKSAAEKARSFVEEAYTDAVNERERKFEDYKAFLLREWKYTQEQANAAGMKMFPPL